MDDTAADRDVGLMAPPVSSRAGGDRRHSLLSGSSELYDVDRRLLCRYALSLGRSVSRTLCRSRPVKRTCAMAEDIGARG